MAPYDVLILGAILLSCGSGGLLIVRLSNSRLKGLGWLGAAFGAGGAGALLTALGHTLPRFLTGALADVLVVSGFVLLHISFLELTERDSIVPRLGLLLLLVQAAFGLAYTLGSTGGYTRVGIIGMLVALQATQTALLLIGSLKKGIRAPALFNIVILLCFAAFNVGRSVATATRAIPAHFILRFETLTYVIYIATALGVAFGFFWMTTATLSSALEHMASTDPLTRIYNRRAFRDWCDRELERSRRDGKRFSLLMIDLDHFKHVNDQFGHQVGDETLCAAVERMQDSIRGIDILGRWGGEEFVVLLPGASLEAAFVIAQRMRSNVEKLTISETPLLSMTDRGKPIKITASLGVASFRGGSDRIEDMLERADRALFDAKAAGRNCVLSVA